MERTVTFDDDEWQLVPKKMTLAMLVASKVAMKRYIDRMPPLHREELGRRHGVHIDIKHQLRYDAALAAAPSIDQQQRAEK